MDEEIRKHFQKNDPVLFAALAIIKPLQPIEKSNDLFLDLCDHIISQQLSTKASATIFKRFIELFPDSQVTPQGVVEKSINELRSAGLSQAKANYVQSLAQLVIDGIVELDRFDALKDQEIIDELVKVKGIGPWTAEMFLMFSLARPDVFSYGDLGLRNGIKKLYGENLSKSDIDALAEKWQPYRTYASRILWHSLDD